MKKAQILAKIDQRIKQLTDDVLILQKNRARIEAAKA
jgi:hypothetical protein